VVDNRGHATLGLACRGYFHADVAAVGRAVRVNGHEMTVIGVTAPEFEGSIRGVNRSRRIRRPSKLPRQQRERRKAKVGQNPRLGDGSQDADLNTSGAFDYGHPAFRNAPLA
jgi:hypothetical protein